MPAVQQVVLPGRSAREAGTSGLNPPGQPELRWIRGKAAGFVGAHEADCACRAEYGVNHKRYWVDETAGEVFCLIDAPDKEAANRVHRETHGLVAHTLCEVEQGAQRSTTLTHIIPISVLPPARRITVTQTVAPMERV